MTQGAAGSSALADLAAARGVLPSFRGNDGHVHRADDEVLRAVLDALGTPVSTNAGAVAALDELRRAEANVVLEPVIALRLGAPKLATVRLPSSVHPREVWWALEHEDGHLWRGRLSSAAASRHSTGHGPDHRHVYTFAVGGEGSGGEGSGGEGSGSEGSGGEALAAGYHRLRVEWPGGSASALVVAAPPCPEATRSWGAFLPLHAVRTDHDWGTGCYPDLVELGQWISALGGSFVGALPLYPAHLDPPADPSPYLPVSRLAYNEVFVDPTALAELAQCPAARDLMASTAFRRRLGAAHRAELVDYEEVARLRREVLHPMAQELDGHDSQRRAQFRAFGRAHPELVAYSRFRAEGGGRPDAAEATYHLYAQWAAAEQLSNAAASVGLHADLPVGVHPSGFDPRWAPQAFATGASGGAPPDLFFAAGQDWSFPPWHPDRMRADGYEHLTAVLRRAFRHAASVRVDHVMGLQRLYWIPRGFDARHGAYVSYRADELHALVCVEAFRAGVVVVGEDLGTVPDAVRSRMARDRMLRTWVLQFESTPSDPLPDPPPAVMASWGTHDLPRFSSYFEGGDLDEDQCTGRLSPAGAAAERAGRARWRRALMLRLGTIASGEDEADAVLRACLLHLAAGPGRLVMVDLEELWGERTRQNRPGTGPEAGNWRQRASTLREARADRVLAGFLRQLSERRVAAAMAQAPTAGVPR